MIQISIKNGRDRFWQWDANQHLVIRGVPDTFHVHFVQEGHEEPLPVLPVKQADGSFLAPVPNILLQTAEEITVYVYYTGTDEQYTQTHKRFYVVSREKPAEYIYTETQLVTWEGMIQQCEGALREATNILTIADACAQNAKEDAEKAQEAANAAAGKVAEAEEQAALAAKSALNASETEDAVHEYADGALAAMSRLKADTVDAAVAAVKNADDAFADAERAEAATEMHAGVIALDSSGATVTLPDSAERPLRALTVDITASIEGRNGTTVTACGKNRLDGSLRVNEWKSTGVTVQYDPEDDTYTLNGTVTANNDLYSIDNVLAVGAGADIALTVEYVSGSVTVGDGQNAVFYIGHSDDGKTRSNFLACHLRQENNSAAKKLQKQYAFRSWFFVSAGVTFDNYKCRIQVELGDTATEYEPFRGATASVDFGREVYGGRYDWRTGELTVTHELADGAVVPLDTPEVVQLEPSALPSTLYPLTTIFADTGDVTLTYAADTKSYIDRRIRELIGG